MGSIISFPPKKRSEFRALAWIRLAEAEVLLRNKKPNGAYYLCGYAVECGLKACIAKKTKRYEFPNKEFVNKSWTHNLTQLVELAGLKGELDSKIRAGGDFASNWKVLEGWGEDARYDKKSITSARDIYVAVSDPRDGVLKWIIQHW